MLSRFRALYAGWKRSRSTESGTASGADQSLQSAEHAERTNAGRASGETRLVGRDESTSWHDLLYGDEVSKQEVQLALGLQPHEFLVWLVRDSGGQMWQADMVDTTGWSKSTVSRYLDVLEASDTVRRIWVGRRKLVAVPGGMPEIVPSPDGPSVDRPADGRSSGADQQSP